MSCIVMQMTRMQLASFGVQGLASIACRQSDQWIRSRGYNDSIIESALTEDTEDHAA